MATIREVLDRKGGAVVTIGKEASVREAIGIMSDANTGIFTERDYLRKIALKGRSSSVTSLHEVMSSPLITVDPGDSVETALETMTTCRCRHLIVSDGAVMHGIVSLGDLVKHMLVEKETEVEQLSHYIAGSY
jgi:CBS domain-containing protein